MDKNICELKNYFEKIKERGWIKSLRQGTDAVGRTFEDLLGRDENSLEIPDFMGIEIKAKRNYTKAYISLFNMTPNGKHYHEIERLQRLYGYPDTKLKNCNVLNNSVYCNKRTFIGVRYQFMLKINRNEEKIYLCVFDVHGNLIEKDVYWDFDILKEKLYRKLTVLALVKAHRKFVNGIEFFKYYNMTLYLLRDFDTFLSLIDQGLIRINFKIGVFKSGIRKGQIHDHGTSFSIKECDLLKLYDEYKL